MKEECRHHPIRVTSLLQMALLSILFAAATPSELQSETCREVQSSISQRDYSSLQSFAAQLEQTRIYPCVLQLHPRYFWAQNMSHIFVKFEFLNSVDTSACERVLWARKEVEHSRFSLNMVCLQSNLLIRYRIAVTTIMPMNFYHALWKQADQNTLILECLKSPNPYFWKRLYLQGQEPPRKPRVWWKMVEKYMEDTRKFIYDLEIEEEETDVSLYVKRKKKGRRVKESEQYEPHSKKHFYCNQNDPFELGSWLV